MSQLTPTPTPKDTEPERDYFSQFPNFRPDHTSPIMDEFDRLANFNSEKELYDWTKETQKVFPRRAAEKDGLLKSLLRGLSGVKKARKGGKRKGAAGGLKP